MDYDDSTQDEQNETTNDEQTAQQAEASGARPRRSRRATRPAMTPERPTLDVLAELGLREEIEAPEPADADVPDAVADESNAVEVPEVEDTAGGDESDAVETDEVETDDSEGDEDEDEGDEDEDEDEGDEDEGEGDEDGDSLRLPATALLFQAPDLTPRRSRRASAPAGPPEAAPEPEPAEEPEVDSGREARAPQRSKPKDRDAGDDSADGGGEDSDDSGDDTGDRDESAPRRRRRRGGRGRRRSKGGDGDDSASEGNGEDTATDDAPENSEESGSATAGRSGRSGRPGKSSRSGGRSAGQTSKPSEPSADEAGDAGDGDTSGEGEAEQQESESSGSRRRRRRRSRSGREDSSSRGRDEVTALKGSTRLEAKRQRRREGRDANRRRAIITEAEFLARRESVDRDMVVREQDGRTQIAVLEDDVLVEHYVARKTQTSMVGNVYLGRVQNVLPSMEAAFVDLGRGRNAVLYAGEVNWDAAGLEGQPRRIEQALSSGDSVMVQVTKDPIGHKGARLTSQITLAGRYLVLVPSGAMTGISRKLPDTERNRLKKLLKEIVPEGQGVIVRTAAEGASEDELRRDVERLTKTWADIDKKVKKTSTSAPVLLKGEPELATRVVRDVFNEDFRSLTVQGDDAWKTISTYVGSVAPDLAERLHHWNANEDVFAAHRIDEQLAKGLDRKVWLPSGGSLVIDRTEAMTVVDVNTGKFTGSGGTLEETVTRNNLEAAEEIVRQLRLRDIGGIIVIDFIDMVLESNRDLVLRRLVECLGRDRTRHQVAEVTSLGLVQMTRKRVGQGLIEAFSTTCEHCHGRGYTLHEHPVESGQSTSETEDTPRSGRGGRGRRRGQQQAPPPAETVEDPAQRAQVRATLAAIAAAAAHAHEEQHLDEERLLDPPVEIAVEVDGTPEEPASPSDDAEPDSEPIDAEPIDAEPDAEPIDAEPVAEPIDAEPDAEPVDAEPVDAEPVDTVLEPVEEAGAS